MNKEEALLQVAKEHLQWDDLVGGGIIVTALEAAYEAGLSKAFESIQGATAPTKPRSTLTYVEATDSTVEVFEAVQGLIEVRMRPDVESKEIVLQIPVERKDDVGYLYEQCATWQLATFRTLCENL